MHRFPSRIALAAALILVRYGVSVAAPEPSDASATQEVRKVLDYLYGLKGRGIVSGQQECGYCSDPAQENKYIFSNTGKYPAILGMDMCDRGKGAIERAIAWWKAGGLPLIGWHMGYPTQGDDYNGSQFKVGAAEIERVVTSGTNENTLFLKRLDEGAAKLKQLQDAGVPVLWRPFHEASGTWFWWSMGGGAAYVKLWKFQYDYYTKTKGLHNLIWVHPYSGSPVASFYPGKAWVDVGGADTYASDHNPQKAMYDKVVGVVGAEMPIALHENGPIPDPEQMKSTGAQWIFFNTWNTNWLTDEKNNAKAFLKSVYANDYVISRDELPKWDTYHVGIRLAGPGRAGKGAYGIGLEGGTGILSVRAGAPGTLTLFDARGSRLNTAAIGAGQAGPVRLRGPQAYGMRFLRIRSEEGSSAPGLPSR